MPSLPQVGTEFAGYGLRAVVARGGMSVVYHAENPRLGNVVALKVLAPELSSNDAFRARFLEESRIAASLNHPNVIPIYDTGPCEDLLYIAMRYVAGADLRTVLEAHEHISPVQALLVIGQVGRALDVAHGRGLVHRDVKPANILIERGTYDDDPDHVYLADFGITKHALTRTGLTATGEFVGTIDYIAPEQIQGRRVDGRADVYSLGCVLYECLTGRVPFKKDVASAVILAHIGETPAPPSSVRPELPHGIDEVIGRALAKDPDDRYASCREFVAAARAVTEPAAGRNVTATSESVLASPDTVLAGTPVTSPPAPVRGGEQPGGGGRTPVEPGARRSGGGRRRAIAVLAVLALAIAGGVVAWASSRGGNSHPSVPAPAHAEMPLMRALDSLNQTAEAKGLLPSSSCRARTASLVICEHPARSIDMVTFRTFPSLAALYRGYLNQTKALAPDHRFRANFGDCLPRTTNGEISWNHNFQHPRGYSLHQSRSGKLTDVRAAGRLYCIFANSRFHIVWTMNDGRLLAMLSGGPHEDTWRWWRMVHHNIDLAAPGSTGSGSHMGHTNPSGKHMDDT